MSHIFISYSKKDIVFARHLKWLLEARGFRVWMDEKSIDPSDDWWETIEASVVNCAAFTVIMSDNARQSRWVRREVLLAENLGKPLFPVLLDGQVWTQLADIQSADMTAGTRAELPDEFLRALKTSLNIQKLQNPPKPRRKPPAWRWLVISVALIAVTLVAGAAILLSSGSNDTTTPTPFDPVREAERLITETEFARIAFLTTPNHTQTVEAILNQFFTETQAAAVTDTPVPPTDPPTATAVETEEVVVDTTDAIEASDTPTRTLAPSETPTRTATPNQGQTQTAEAQQQATLLQSARMEQATLQANCPGSPSPSRLRTGIVAQVTEGGLPSRLRSEPNTNGEILESIPQLEQFMVVDGPVCDEQQLRWWQVEYQGTVGWVAEGVGEEYYLEPARTE